MPKKCEHGRRLSRCKECGGSSLCVHGRHPSMCKECGGCMVATSMRVRPPTQPVQGVRVFGAVCVRPACLSRNLSCAYCWGGVYRCSLVYAHNVTKCNQLAWLVRRASPAVCVAQAAGRTIATGIKPRAGAEQPSPLLVRPITLAGAVI